MFCLVSCTLLAISVGLANGALQEVTVSQANYASLAAKLVMARYDELLAEGKAIEPATNACHEKFSTKNASCMSCVDSASQCGSTSPLVVILQTIKDPSNLLPLAEKGLKALGDQIASGATKLFEKYGVGTVKVLQTGFNKIGQAFKDLGSTFMKGFEFAFDKIKFAFTKVVDFGKAAGNTIKDWAKGFIDLFGGRKRRSVSYRERRAYEEELAQKEAIDLKALGTREKRADELSPSAKACLLKQCSVCSPFLEADNTLDTWRLICGADVIDKNVALTDTVEKTEQFYAALLDDKKDALSKIMVDTTTGLVDHLVALKGTAYVTLRPTNIAFNPWNQDPAYEAITEFILDHF